MKKREVVARCMECDEVITTPLCTNCLSVQMFMMIREYDSRLAKKVVVSTMEGDTPCLSCGKGISVCVHCYSKEVYEFLKDRNTPVAVEFMRRFDFGLRKELNQSYLF